MFIGLGLSLTGLRGGAAFTPASLFASGDAGAWYDGSDLATLFQDTAGTTPVTTANQSVGLALDKSKGLALGPRLETNGTFDTASDWTLGAGWTISGGVLAYDGTDAPNIVHQPSTALISPAFYRVDISVSLSQGALLVRPQYNTSAGQVQIEASGDYSIILQGKAAGGLGFLAGNFGGRFVGTIDNISARILPGSHSTQGTGSFQGKYQTGPQRLAFDGIDDRLLSTLNPAASGSIAVRMRSNTASRIAVGSQAASDGRCYIGLASDGALAGGIGTQATSVIKGSTDIRTAWTTGILTWNGTTVTLYQNGASVYSAAQSGAVNTTIPVMVGGLNSNGTGAAFHAGDIARAIIINRVLTAGEIASLTALWSTIE